MRYWFGELMAHGVTATRRRFASLIALPLPPFLFHLYSLSPRFISRGGAATRRIRFAHGEGVRGEVLPLPSMKLTIMMLRKMFIPLMLVLPLLSLAQDPWIITANKIDPTNYYGVTVANGMIGIV